MDGASDGLLDCHPSGSVAWLETPAGCEGFFIPVRAAEYAVAEGQLKGPLDAKDQGITGRNYKCVAHADLETL